MAISVAWQTVAAVTASTTLATVYTVPSASTASFGAYARDLVITNSGTGGTVFACLSAAGAVTAAAGFQIPTGGTVILTQCQVPAGAVIGIANTNSTNINVSVGYATNVAYI